MQEKYFCGDNVIDDVTGWPQIQLYIFPYGISSGKKSFTRSLNGGRFENAKLLNKYSILHQII